jgi:hypothetical protein
VELLDSLGLSSAPGIGRIDEASQCDIGSALPLLARARRADNAARPPPPRHQRVFPCLCYRHLQEIPESVSAVNSSAVGGEARGFAALCTCTGREKGRAARDPAPFVPFSLTGIDAVPPREVQRVYNISSPTMAVCDPFAPDLEHWVSAARGT